MLKRKRLFIILSTLIVVFACFCLAAGLKKTPQAAKSAAPNITKADTVISQEARQLVVYYFMTSYRCRSCIFIEGTTRKAVEENFANEIKNGRIVFKMLNIEEPQNKHFADEYGLFTKSVVLSDLKGGKQNKWKNLDQVWNLIGKEDEFKTYIAKEIKSYLGS